MYLIKYIRWNLRFDQQQHLSIGLMKRHVHHIQMSACFCLNLPETFPHSLMSDGQRNRCHTLSACWWCHLTMLFNCHIFFALLSCRSQYMKTWMIQFPALELSLAGLLFHSQVFVSLCTDFNFPQSCNTQLLFIFVCHDLYI